MKVVVALLLACGVAEASSHCHETSPILGRRHCGNFGQRWAHEPWIGIFSYELALVYEHVATPAFDERGNVYSATQTAAYHAVVAPGSRSHLDAIGPRQRFGYHGTNLTLAFEVTFAFGVASPTVVTQVDGFPASTSKGGSLFDVAGVAGLHTRVDRWQLGGETAIGFRDVLGTAELPDGFTSCAGGATGKGCYFAPSDAQLLVELRGRADYWVNPDFTVGLMAGVDVAARGESLVLMLGYHASPFDGD